MTTCTGPKAPETINLGAVNGDDPKVKDPKGLKLGQTLSRSGMFHTPETLEELYAWIERHPAGDGTQLHCWTAAMMMFNYMAILYNRLAKEYIDVKADRDALQELLDSDSP